jgi:hypothetical protein
MYDYNASRSAFMTEKRIAAKAYLEIMRGDFYGKAGEVDY